ncbi:MAG: GtrA family protein [Oscillospiraceae bacterium]|nr:GtrA family protein [Oscillospiraceae bacterium]
MSTNEKNTQKLTKKQTIIQTIKFALFSGSAGIIQLSTFSILETVVHLDYWPSYLTSLILSILWNFTFNRKFTFKSATNIPIAMLKVAGFYCVFTPVSTWLGDMFVKTYGVNDFIVLAVTMITNLVTEYLFCRFVVYRNSMNTNDLAKKEQEKEAAKSNMDEE